MRKALIVGIDHYEHIGSLAGCVNDAHSVKAMLDRHADGSVNFGTKLVAGMGPADVVTRSELKEAVRELFADKMDVSLFYFAGHGYIEATGGYLCAGDCRTGDDGLPLAEIMALANDSPARNRIVILDSCHGGALGNSHINNQISEIREGMTILTASTKDQYAAEEGGGGLFTGLLVDALGGAAANLIGEVTPGSVYAHVDQSLGNWSQRPVFKTNVDKFVSLRKVQPPLPLADLQRIAELFPTKGYEFPLNPSYEPKDDRADWNRKIHAIIPLKNSEDGRLRRIGATHPYDAAMESKSMKLTALGEHYRRLVADNLI